MDNITPRQEEAYSLYQKAIQLVKQQSVLFFDIGETFKNIRDNKMWQYMGEGGMETWEQFLSQPEIYLAPQTVRAYIHIYEVYIVKLGLDRDKLVQVPFYKLNMLASFIQNLEPDKALEVIDDLKVLGAKDFNEELKILQGKQPDEQKSKKEKEVEALELLLIRVATDVEQLRGAEKITEYIHGLKDVLMEWHKKFKL